MYKFRAFDLEGGLWSGNTEIETLKEAKFLLRKWDCEGQIISYIFDKIKRVLHIPLKYKKEYPKHSERITKSILINEDCEIKEVVYYKQITQ